MDGATVEQIAQRLGVSERRVRRWMRRPEWQSTRDEVVRVWREQLAVAGLRSREYRIGALQELFDRLASVVRARAEDPALATVPGGRSGLITASTKVAGRQAVIDYVVDHGTIREMREIARQIAIEMGEWGDDARVQRRDEPIDVVPRDYRAHLAPLAPDAAGDDDDEPSEHRQ